MCYFTEVHGGQCFPECQKHAISIPAKTETVIRYENSIIKILVVIMNILIYM